MRTFVIVLSVIALVGCKTDKTNKTGSGSAQGSGSAVGSAKAGSGAGSGASLALPKSDGSKPKRTTAALDKNAFEKLAELSYPGFDKSVRNKTNSFDVRHTTPRPKLATTVTIAPCFDCTPMELDKWQAKSDGLKLLLAEELRALPDTIWEIGKTEVAGEPMMFTYQFGYKTEKDAMGNPAGAFSNAYALYWNDGKNQIRVVAEYKDDWVAREDMLTIAPREDLEKLARAFMDVYIHAW